MAATRALLNVSKRSEGTGVAESPHNWHHCFQPGRGPDTAILGRFCQGLDEDSSLGDTKGLICSLYSGDLKRQDQSPVPYRTSITSPCRIESDDKTIVLNEYCNTSSPGACANRGVIHKSMTDVLAEIVRCLRSILNNSEHFHARYSRRW